MYLGNNPGPLYPGVDFTAQITQIFQSTMGRAPTDTELQTWNFYAQNDGLTEAQNLIAGMAAGAAAEAQNAATTQAQVQAAETAESAALTVYNQTTDYSQPAAGVSDPTAAGSEPAAQTPEPAAVVPIATSTPAPTPAPAVPVPIDPTVLDTTQTTDDVVVPVTYAPTTLGLPSSSVAVLAIALGLALLTRRRT